MRHKGNGRLGQFGVGHVLYLAYRFIMRTDSRGLELAFPQFVDRPDVEDAHHAGHDTVRLATGVNFIHTQIALLDDLFLWIPLGGTIGTCCLAFAAADAQGGVDIDDAVLAPLPDGTSRTGRQAGRLGAVVAGHIHLVGKYVRISSTFNVHYAPEAWAGRQAVLVLAGDFAGAAADAVNVVVDETELHGRFDRFVCLGHLALKGDLDFLHVEFVGHGRPLMRRAGR